jgi:hypothetical protein
MSMLLLAMLVSGPQSQAQGLGRAGWRSVANTMIILDWAQTKHIATDDDYYEANPILGKHPSASEVDNFFAASLLLTNLVGGFLPVVYQTTWFKVVSVTRAGVVAHNAYLGVDFRF